MSIDAVVKQLIWSKLKNYRHYLLFTDVNIFFAISKNVTYDKMLKIDLW